MPLKLITVNILIRIIPILRQVDIFLIKVARREKAFSIRRLDVYKRQEINCLLGIVDTEEELEEKMEGF